jgi:RNA polymerase sigma-70 factor (ECF subfamily)
MQRDGAGARRTPAALRLLAEEIEAAAAGGPAPPDERLSLMFACAHPALDPGVRAPLILQTILGFDAAAIGSAFLTSPATMAQRLVRAKRKIRDAGIPFQVPERAELAERLDAVLEAIYAAYSEGWSDPAGTETRRRNLAEDGIWLCRLVVSLLPEEAEALGLLSLMLHAQARRDARRDSQGEYVPLADQDPAAWDTALIEEAEGLLSRASACPGSVATVEAAVQSRTGCGGRPSDGRDRRSTPLLAAGSPVVASTAPSRWPDARAEAALGAEGAETTPPRQYQPYCFAACSRAGNVAASAAYERGSASSDLAVRRFSLGGGGAARGRRAGRRPGASLGAGSSAGGGSGGGGGGTAAVTTSRSASPFSKSPPTILSMFMTSDIAFATKLLWPLIDHVTSVPRPPPRMSNCAVFVAWNGFRNSRRIVTLSGGTLSVIVMRPSPTSSLPTQW